MDKHIDVASPHCEAMPNPRLLEWQLDDLRRQADDVRREKIKAASERLDRHRKGWISKYSLFSFGELADIYVSRMPIDEDPQQGREKFFEHLRASVASGEFERGGRPQISVISPDGVYRLSAELMEAGDGDAMQALLEQCWTLPAIGIEWCGRLEIELPSRWKNLETGEIVSNNPSEKARPTLQNDDSERKYVAEIVESLKRKRKCPMNNALDAIGSIQIEKPEELRSDPNKSILTKVQQFCKNKNKRAPGERTFRTARNDFLAAYDRTTAFVANDSRLVANVADST